MKNKKEFDCVKFQRDAREKNIMEANYNIRELASNIILNMKDNELYKFFKERKEKEKQLETA